MRHSDESPAVVVGVDGSAAATRAALWAATEARERGLPLRLVFVIDPADAKPDEDDAERWAAAEIALRQASSAAATVLPGLPIELRISRGKPVDVLRDTSRSAALVCTGIRGRHHFADGHTGSTAESLARSAHCPVAVVHDSERPTQAGQGCVVAEVDDSADGDAVIQLAVDEALLRRAPLRVLTSWGTCPNGLSGNTDDGLRVSARLERRLDRWRRKHPELDIAAAAVHGPSADYLARHGSEIQLAVTGAHNTSALLGKNGQPTVHSGSSILIANARRM